MNRTAGEIGLAPRACVCDPMDLAALGHMTNCPCYEPPPLMTHRIGTPQEDHQMTVEALRDALDSVVKSFEPSEETPVPVISFPAGFWITYSARDEAVQL